MEMIIFMPKGTIPCPVIVPHALLPSHPNVTLVGIRDFDKQMHFDIQGSLWGWNTQDNAPLFSGVEWVRSLVGKEMFPRRKFTRNLSRGSAMMRRAGALLLMYDYYKEGNEDRPRIEVRILKFWDKVMMKCFDSRYKKRQESSE